MNSLNTEDVGFAVQCLIADYLAGNVHTAMPGKVESYDPLTRTGQVKPLLKIAHIDKTQTELQSIADVPFAIYGTASAGVVLPINTGDYVLLIFNERTIGKAMKTGNASSTSLTHLFGLGDAVALPGLFPQPTGPHLENQTDIQIYNKSGNVLLAGPLGLITIEDNPLAGVVTGMCACSITGAVHPVVSQTVRATL